MRQQNAIDGVACRQQKSKVMALADLVSGEGPLPLDRLFTVSSQGDWGGQGFWAFFSKGTNPKRPYLLIPSPWRLGFQHKNLGDTNICSIAGPVLGRFPFAF